MCPRNVNCLVMVFGFLEKCFKRGSRNCCIFTYLSRHFLKCEGSPKLFPMHFKSMDYALKGCLYKKYNIQHSIVSLKASMCCMKVNIVVILPWVRFQISKYIKQFISCLHQPVNWIITQLTVISSFWSTKNQLNIRLRFSNWNIKCRSK